MVVPVAMLTAIALMGSLALAVNDQMGRGRSSADPIHGSSLSQTLSLSSSMELNHLDLSLAVSASDRGQSSHTDDCAAQELNLDLSLALIASYRGQSSRASELSALGSSSTGFGHVRRSGLSICIEEEAPLLHSLAQAAYEIDSFNENRIPQAECHIQDVDDESEADTALERNESEATCSDPNRIRDQTDYAVNDDERADAIDERNSQLSNPNENSDNDIILVNDDNGSFDPMTRIDMTERFNVNGLRLAPTLRLVQSQRNFPLNLIIIRAYVDATRHLENDVIEVGSFRRRVVQARDVIHCLDRHCGGNVQRFLDQYPDFCFSRFHSSFCSQSEPCFERFPQLKADDAAVALQPVPPMKALSGDLDHDLDLIRDYCRQTADLKRRHFQRYDWDRLVKLARNVAFCISYHHDNRADLFRESFPNFEFETFSSSCNYCNVCARGRSVVRSGAATQKKQLKRFLYLEDRQRRKAMRLSSNSSSSH